MYETKPNFQYGQNFLITEDKFQHYLKAMTAYDLGIIIVKKPQLVWNLGSPKCSVWFLTLV